ncbi:MAG: DHH family phosphoesterase [Oscillospiraceae bacterium]|nr:DHH family phosphoesterase [Oscillospiraceae bacterium]
MTQELSELISVLKGHRVYIQTHNFPDPDAIASAYGLQVLLENFGIITIICHHGVVERAATMNMVSEFKIDMTTDNDLYYMSEDDYIVNVDSQKGNANIRDLIGNEVAVIDHHPVFTNIEEYKFKDIRMVGSCSTIIADYFRQNEIEIPESVATALLYGLKCDTRNFTRGVKDLDVEIYSYLFPYANHQLIRHFQSGEILYDELNDMAKSLQKVEIVDGVGFAYLDFACPDAFIATISDFLMQIDAVFFSVVYSHRDNGFKFSVRSEYEDLDAGKIISEALENIGSGGGHESMAGGYVSEEKLSKISTDYSRTIQELFLNNIKSKLKARL